MTHSDGDACPKAPHSERLIVFKYLFYGSEYISVNALRLWNEKKMYTNKHYKCHGKNLVTIHIQVVNGDLAS